MAEIKGKITLEANGDVWIEFPERAAAALLHDRRFEAHCAGEPEVGTFCGIPVRLRKPKP